MPGQMSGAVLVFVTLMSNFALAQDTSDFALAPGLRPSLQSEKIDDDCPIDKPDLDPDWIATNIIGWNQLSLRQQDLLGNYLRKLKADAIPEIDYTNWVTHNNGPIATFLALTRALAKTTINVAGGSQSALDIIKEIKSIEVTRIRAEMDSATIQEWDRGGGHFSMALANGKTETGRVRFKDGTVPLSGKLHCGYDIQGVTSRLKVPRIQWNYRYADAEADIDLDGFSTVIWGFIPNPKHLTYANSDVRHWLDK